MEAQLRAFLTSSLDVGETSVSRA